MRPNDASKWLGGALLEAGTRGTSARLYDGRAGGSIGEEPHIHARKHAAEAAKTALRMFVAGFGIEAGHGESLVERLLPGACARWCAEPGERPEACALLHAEDVFEAWLTRVLGTEGLAGQPALPVGRAAFLACGGPTAWPDMLLVDEDLPEAFVAAMRAAAPRLAPMPMPGTMTAQSLESWSTADVERALGELLDENLAWLAHARPLVAAPIKLGKSPS